MIDFFCGNMAASNFCDDRKSAQRQMLSLGNDSYHNYMFQILLFMLIKKKKTLKNIN